MKWKKFKENKSFANKENDGEGGITKWTVENYSV